MNINSRIFKIIWKVSYGILSGILWYLLFVYIIPIFLSLIGLPFEEVPEFFLFILSFFIGIETAASFIENIVYKFLLNSFTKVLGLWLLFGLLNDGILSTTFSSQGSLVSITMDFTPILFLIAIWTFATILLDFVGAISKPYF